MERKRFVALAMCLLWWIAGVEIGGGIYTGAIS